MDYPYSLEVRSADKTSSLPLCLLLVELLSHIQQQCVRHTTDMDALAGLERRTSDDMVWVVTVPVLWFYSAKTVSLVRHCVRTAGMCHCALCSDSVAAAHHLVKRESGVSRRMSDKVLLDCGASSIDALTVRMDHRRVAQVGGKSTLTLRSALLRTQSGLVRPPTVARGRLGT